MSNKTKVLPWFDPEDTQDYFCLTWNITRKCAFRCPFCSYCDQSDDLTPELLDADFNKVTTWIQTHFPRSKAYTQISIFGGEPTTHPVRCEHAINVARSVAGNVTLYTNLQMPVRLYRLWMIRYPELRLIVTFHEHRYPPDKFMDDITHLQQFKDRISITVTDADPSSSAVMRELQRCGFQVNWLEIIPCGNLHLHKSGELAEGDHTVASEHWSEHVNDHTNHFQGWTCLAGKNNLYIEANGDVYPCQGQSASHHNARKARIPLFNVVDTPDIVPTFEATICPRKKCRLELFVSKYKQV